MEYLQITSRENEKVKLAVKLNTSARTRRETGLFVCDGKKLCLEALAEQVPICTLFFTQLALDKDGQTTTKLADAAAEAYLVSPGVMDKLSGTKSPQGILCLCSPSPAMKQANRLESLTASGHYICLEHIADPGNLGTIIRTAAAFGADGVVLTKDSADIYSEKVIRSAMGSVFKIPIILVDDMPQTIVYLKELGVCVFATALGEHSVLPHRLKGQKGAAVLIGNEANGLCKDSICLCDHTVKIPMQNGVESLNAAVAATVCLWEMQQ